MSVKKAFIGENFLMVFLLFVLSFLLRFFLISKGPYDADCLSLALLVQKVEQTHQLQYFFGSGYPLTVFWGAVFVHFLKWFGMADPVYAVNLMSVVFSSLAVAVFYSIGLRFLGPLGAILSSVLFSVNPLFLGVSVYGSSQPLAIFFLLSSILFLLKFLEREDRLFLFLSGIFLGLTGASRLQEMFLILGPLVFLFLANKNIKPAQSSHILKFFLIAFLTAGVFYLPFLLGAQKFDYLKQLAFYRQLSVAKEFQIDAFKAVGEFLFAALLPVGIALSLCGMWYLFKEKRPLFIFFILWVILPWALYSFLYTITARFIVFMLPVCFWAQGFVFVKFFNFNKWSRTISLVIFVTMFFIMFNTIYPLLSLRHERAFTPEYAEWVKEKIPVGSAIIVTDDRLFFEYYGQNKILGRPLKYFDYEEGDLLDFQKKLDRLLDSNISVYITYVGLFDYDPKERFSQFMKAHYILKEVGVNLYEDWHQGAMVKRIFYNPLVKIEKRSREDEWQRLLKKFLNVYK